MRAQIPLLCKALFSKLNTFPALYFVSFCFAITLALLVI